MKIYISGPMAGYPDLNFSAFDEAEKELVSQGHIAVSPAGIGRRNVSMSYEYKLREAIRLMLECEAVFFLRGWEFSLGARTEMQIAHALKMGVFHQDSA
jgi:hypothetical protein